MDNLRVFTNKSKKKLIKKVDRSEIIIRDIRDKFYMKDGAYLNDWGMKCGRAASLVYDALCKYANVVDQTCYPSRALIASKIGYSERHVTRGLKILEAFRIIIVERGTGMRNVYLLTDKASWKDPGEGKSFYKIGRMRKATRGERAGVVVSES
jgi:hypothetical protein